MKTATIDDVRAFWNANPLWSGDSQAQGSIGNKEYFESHTRACLTELGGSIEPQLLPASMQDKILDLGCGIGFWLEMFGTRGYRNLTGADLSTQSLALAQRRCELLDIPAQFSEQDAEAMTFDADTFDHVQCMGVIHHSPDPAASLREIHRVLKPGGHAVVAVYYKHFALRYWRLMRPLIALAGIIGFTPRGRGRDGMMENAPTPQELVRLYDGADNPIGVAFTRDEYHALVKRSAPWSRAQIFTFVFPARTLPFHAPRWLFKIFEFISPVMICARLTK